MTAIVGVIQGSQALKMPVMQKFIVVTTLCNTAENRTPLIVSRTENDFFTPAASSSGHSAVSSCPILIPPSVCICNGSIGNIRHTDKPNVSETSEFNTSIDRILSNYFIAPYVVSQILCDEFFVSSRRNIYLRCRMESAVEIVQPMGAQLKMM